MWKYCVSCVVSAVVGGCLVMMFAENRHLDSSAAAQEALPGKNPNNGERKTPPQPGPETDADRDLANPRTNQSDRNHSVDSLFDQDGLTAEERVSVAVYDRGNRSVAHITIKGVRETGFFALEVPTEGSGSGSVLDMEGNILTNNHVIEGARQVSVTLFDGRSYDAKFVGADPVNDIAVIRIDAPAESLYPVEMGDSRRLRVGMRVFAIGNPFGLERTLTTGIISSLNRTLQVHENRTIRSIIQIDAAINPGNSGGPLLDAHGRLIGINTAIASKTGQSAGVGFAIPVTIVQRVVPQLLEKGRVTRPEIGIAKVFETEVGLLVYRLVPGGAAERAGMRGPRVVNRRRGLAVFEIEDKTAADLIVGIDGEKTTTADDFLAYIESKQPGDRVIVQIIRAGKAIEIPLVLGGE